jgi:enterochelin esterase family protein
MSTPAALVFSLVGPLILATSTRTAEPLSAQELSTRLSANPTGHDALALAQEVRAWFGKDRAGRNNVLSGANPKVEELLTAWAVEAPSGATSAAVAPLGVTSTLPLTRIGDTPLFAGVFKLTHGKAHRWSYQVDGKNFGRQRELEVYTDQPELAEKPGVPKGKLTPQKPWESKIFPGSTRQWWVYVPAQYTDDQPACVMIFQDGGGYTGFVPTVFDNLIAKGDMPVTVAVFINPGSGGEGGRGQRSLEYDTLSDRYARFLLEEILPEVEKTVKLRHDPESRAIAGISSGGICAWTVAWERPDEFRKVLSWVGSFTNIASGKTRREGGHNYEALIRKTPKKPIRIFLQDGANDLDNNNGNWPLANQQMAKALKFAGYDYQFVYGEGFHSNRHGRSILPESLRWLWRDYEAAVEGKPGE